jgi:hypothetical protein
VNEAPQPWPRSDHPGLNLAVEWLLHAGMVLRYSASYQHSYYLGWPERSGVLRVADHSRSRTRERANGAEVFASVTLNGDGGPVTEDRIVARCAHALGFYLYRAPLSASQTKPDTCQIPRTSEPGGSRCLWPECGCLTPRKEPTP